MIRKILITLSILIMATMLAACSFSGGSQPTATLNNSAIQTQVAAALAAQKTQQAGQQAIDRLTEIAKTAVPATAIATKSGEATQAPQPSNTPAAPSATPTQAPTATAVPPTPVPPTATAVPPTATAVPPTPVPPTPIPQAPTPIPTPCNWAMFVEDISAPDGTAFIGGSQFTKTWRIKNIGTCNWTREYAMVYQSGDQMSGAKVNYLEDTVHPGDIVDISIDFIAPSADGKYTGYWRMRTQNGTFFGMGDHADEAFWVQILVTTPGGVAYNFANHMCDAEWRTKDGIVTCTLTPSNRWELYPTNPIETNMGSGENVVVVSGSVERVENPKVETGHIIEDKVAIVVFPNDDTGGYISGKFPERKILDGDWFRTTIGCMIDSPKCNVTFKLQYQVAGGSVQTLGTWKQTYDGKIQNVDVDLSFLAGKRVVFILTVQNNGSNTDDYAFWLYPRIAR